MATKLTKPVTRVSSELVRDRGKMCPLVVTIHPNGFIGIRPQGMRKEELYPIEAVYSIALKARVAAEKAERKARRKGLKL